MLAVAFVVLALLKPWTAISGGAGAGTISPPPPTATPPSPSPTVDPALAAALDRRQCQSDTGWRLVTRERDGDIDSRTLWEVPQLAPTASLALDRPFRLWAQAVMAMGFCAPGATAELRVEEATHVTLSRVLDDGHIASVTNTIVTDTELAALGEIYLAPPKAMSPAGIWPAGDYLFRVQPRGSDAGGWFALQVLQPPQAPG